MHCVLDMSLCDSICAGALDMPLRGKKRNGGIMEDKRDELRESTIRFALNVSDICEEINGCKSYVDQIIRSSSSIGANLFEAKYAQSRADFIHKLEISLKECSETEFWLELLFRKNKISSEQFFSLNNARGTIQRKLIASITTAKKNGESE